MFRRVRSAKGKTRAYRKALSRLGVESPRQGIFHVQVLGNPVPAHLLTVDHVPEMEIVAGCVPSYRVLRRPIKHPQVEEGYFGDEVDPFRDSAPARCERGRS